MPRWRKKTLDEMTAHLAELGLQQCPICQSGAMSVRRQPVIEAIGEAFRERERRTDPDANVLFMVAIVCEVCGYQMLFDSEKFSSSNEQTLVTGWTPEEEAAWEAQRGGN